MDKTKRTPSKASSKASSKAKHAAFEEKTLPNVAEDKPSSSTKMDNVAKQSWRLDFAATSLPYDPLLNCLLILAKFYHRPSSGETLIAGLPLVDYKLTPELFSRAAARIGLSAEVVKVKLDEIAHQSLPAVLFLKDKQACVLHSIDSIEANLEDSAPAPQEGATPPPTSPPPPPSPSTTPPSSPPPPQHPSKKIAQIIHPDTAAGYTEISLTDLEKDYTGYSIFVKPQYDFGKSADEAFTKPRLKHWFWGVVGRALPLYGEIIAASFLINMFALASPLFVMNVYDRVVPNGATVTLWVLVIGVAIVFSFDFIMRSLRAIFIDSVGKKIDTQLSSNTFTQIMGLQMAMRPTSAGTLANTVNVFESFREFITSATVSLLVDIPFAFLFVAVIGFLGGTMALVPLVFMPLILMISFMMQASVDEMAQESHRYAAERQKVLLESLVGIETVKCMRAEGLMQRKWEDIIRILAKLGVKMRMLANVGVNASILFQQLALVAVVIVGVYKIVGGSITLGALIACVILVGRTLSPIAQLAVLLTRYKQARISLTALDQVMKLPIERPEGKAFLHKADIRGGIEFKNVTFLYTGQQVPALQDISFSIKPGEHVAIVGRTGSGKSTLEKLILKLYEATSGSILIDGIEIQQLDPDELRHYIGYIPQDVILFHGTIRDNITMSAPYVDDDMVMRAAALSGVDSFVNQHPQGFACPVYERGQNLSGGQRQTIALARALLLNPPILIFDEPCSSVDDITIQRFFSKLKQHMINKTVIMITHKSSLLGLIDRLIVIDGGRIVIDGAKNEVFAKLRGVEGSGGAAVSGGGSGGAEPKITVSATTPVASEGVKK